MAQKYAGLLSKSQRTRVEALAKAYWALDDSELGLVAHLTKYDREAPPAGIIYVDKELREFLSNRILIRRE